MKPILVVTHERSGTHLTINLINHLDSGKFTTIGYLPKSPTTHYKREDYINSTWKDVHLFGHIPDLVCKSHHQVEFMEDYLDFVFSKFKVIYVKRDLLDMLTSYYKFLFNPQDPKPPFEDWIFMSPNEVGQKYLLTAENHFKGPDPHIFREPENYIQRWKWHHRGWEKYNSDILLLNYEDILHNFPNQKVKIEEFTGRKIADKIPDPKDPLLTNFNPGKGIVGSHKEVMSPELISKILDKLNEY